MKKEKIIYSLLFAYMVLVSLFGYVVLTEPKDVEAQCASLYLSTSLGVACGGVTTNWINTGNTPGNVPVFSGICYQ